MIEIERILTDVPLCVCRSVEHGETAVQWIRTVLDRPPVSRPPGVRLHLGMVLRSCKVVANGERISGAGTAEPLRQAMKSRWVFGRAPGSVEILSGEFSTYPAGNPSGFPPPRSPFRAAPSPSERGGNNAIGPYQTVHAGLKFLSRTKGQGERGPSSEYTREPSICS